MDAKALERFRKTLIAVTLVGAGVLVGLLGQAIRIGDAPSGAERLPRTQTQLAAAQGAPERLVPDVLVDTPPVNREGLGSPFVVVAEAVIPAVVSIQGYRLIAESETDGAHREMFRRLFPRRGGDEGDGEAGFEIPSSGSGFVIDAAGFVLTNDHVVAGAERVSVQLADGREYDAYLMGTDPGTDVAVLRIEVPETDPPLPVLPLGNSDDMVVGDWAVAVGNPLGELQGSFTVGVISATGRSNLRIAGGGPTYQDFIQTDASINFGNSGGPLVNIRGEAIGINSAVNPTGQGLGFAIPINMARDVAVELIGSGTVRRGFLGIVPQELTDAARDTWRVDSAVLGVLVGNVQEDTPASRGGLEEGDVITQFNGREVSDVPEFRRIVADAGVGATVPIRISRDGRERGLEVVLVLRPDTPEPPPDAESVGAETWLGARFQDVTPELVALFNLHRSEGVVLTRIDMGRPAAAGGLRVGDLVLELNERQVKDVGGLQAAFKDAVSNGDRLVFRVQRGRQTTRIDILWEG